MKYIVSDEHKFIYFVVQKTACTSIKTALLPLFEADSSLEDAPHGGVPYKPDIHKFFDNSPYQIKKKQLVRKFDDTYRGYFKFTFVRNPWDRLLSCYLNKLAEGECGMKSPPDLAARVYPGMPFGEFVEIVYETPDKEANIHFKSQCSVICGRRDSKTILADFVGRFENLKADFDAVAEKIGDSRIQQIPHLMRAKTRKSRSYKEFYDDRLKNLVYKRYRDDVETFDYSF